MNLELVEKDKNNCIIKGSVTRGYIKDIVSAGDSFIKRAESPSMDFSGCIACDSSSVALLVHWWRFAKKEGKQVTFNNITSEMRSIMSLCNVGRLLNL